MRLERIEHDLFDIASRLKEVDERYELFFNKSLNRYEIFANGVLQIAVPFDRLDARTVEFARKTRLENLQKLVESIDRENALLDEMKRKQTIENCLKQAEV